ncbi:MAG: protein O-GlcNAc transferase [Arenicella sp.]|jgi:protein O-GlcNAc transferase
MPSSYNHSNSTVAEILAEGKRLHKRGELNLAGDTYTQVLEQDERNSDALYLSGLIKYRKGEVSQAITLINKAIVCAPQNALALASLGQIYLDQRRYVEALTNFTSAFKFSPNNANICNGLGLSLFSLEDYDVSRTALERSISIDPKFFDARFNLGTLESKLGNTELARRHYLTCLRLRPNDADVFNSIGALFFSQRLFDQALALFEQALNRNACSAEAHNNIGAIYIERKEYALALQHFLCATGLRASFAQAHVNAAMANHLLGQTSVAIETVELATRISPNFQPLPYYARAFMDLEPVYQSTMQMHQARHKYQLQLQRLADYRAKLDGEGRSAFEALLGYVTPFYLPYHGLNDKELQVQYGRCIAPRQITPGVSSMPNKVLAQRPIRVGIVSSFFYDHSNWKIPIESWLSALHGKVEINAYYTGHKQDDCTAKAIQLVDKFYQDLSFEELRGQIKQDQIDVLIYPEIGMSALTARLASYRLAPVQATSWGHPVTSGLPSIDYFLSSELMEPEQAQSWYSEKLVCLPGLSFVCTPTVLKSRANARTSIGLSDDDCVFLCVQNISKYLPQYDSLYAEIATQVEACKFVFIKVTSEFTQQRFEQRLQQAFERLGLDVYQHCVFLDRLDKISFTALNQMADVCLDTPQWSGCNSSLEAISLDLPIVTYAGDSMRGRHTLAMYQQMGVEGLVAHTPKQYVDIACRLAQDVVWRTVKRNEISEHKVRLSEGLDSLQIALLQFFDDSLSETKQPNDLV